MRTEHSPPLNAHDKPEIRVYVDPRLLPKAELMHSPCATPCEICSTCYITFWRVPDLAK